MRFLEKDLESIVASTPIEQLRKRGLWLPLNGRMFRQLRIGNYGIADLVHVRRDFSWDSVEVVPTLFFRIMELKQDQITEKALMQAVKYGVGIQNYIRRFRGKDIPIDIRIILIGRTVSEGDFFHAPDVLENVQILTYDYEYDGIRFHQHCDTYLNNDGFHG